MSGFIPVYGSPNLGEAADYTRPAEVIVTRSPAPVHNRHLERPGCSKAIVSLVALLAIGALTFALLSHFDILSAGSIGTISLFAVAGVSGATLAYMLARARCTARRNPPALPPTITARRDLPALPQTISGKGVVLNLTDPQNETYTIQSNYGPKIEKKIIVQRWTASDKPENFTLIDSGFALIAQDGNPNLFFITMGPYSSCYVSIPIESFTKATLISTNPINQLNRK